MGYETKAFIVEHRGDIGISNDGWCSVIGMVDLCKLGYDGRISELMNKYREKTKKIDENKRPFFYDSFGDKEVKVSKDKYGEPFPLIPIREFLDALEEDSKPDSSEWVYRRFEIALPFIHSFFKSKSWQCDINKIYVMTYGY